jgi:hypothetical protein
MNIPPIHIDEQLSALGKEIGANKSPCVLVWTAQDRGASMRPLGSGAFSGVIRGTREEITAAIAEAVVGLARQQKLSTGKVLTDVLDFIEQGR